MLDLAKKKTKTQRRNIHTNVRKHTWKIYFLVRGASRHDSGIEKMVVFCNIVNRWNDRRDIFISKRKAQNRATTMIEYIVKVADGQ